MRAAAHTKASFAK